LTGDSHINAVDALMAVLGCGLLAYGLFGLVTGVIYDSEEPHKIEFGKQPVTFFLYVGAVFVLALVLIDLGFKVGATGYVRSLF
jgi:hypothetical protein